MIDLFICIGLIFLVSITTIEKKKSTALVRNKLNT